MKCDDCAKNINNSNRHSTFKYVFEDPENNVTIQLSDKLSTLNGKDHSRYLLLGAMDVQLTAILNKLGIEYTISE